MTQPNRSVGRPPTGRPTKVRVIIQLDPDTLAALDATRGGKDRSAWIRDAIEDRLRDELRDAGK